MSQVVDTAAIVKSLQALRAKASAPVGPSGLPQRRDNADVYDGHYDGENLTELGFNHNGVVGTGSGPVIGGVQNRQ